MRYAFIFHVLLVALSANELAAQAENNWWYFHNAAVDFGSSPPAVHTTSAMVQNEGSSSISSATGELLFYTDGITVWNRNDAPMPNGNGLLGGYSAAQSALIVPAPGHCDVYYLFTVPEESNTIPLAYSIVDMSLAGGLGDITLKNIPLIAGVTEGLTATFHTNGVDRWVVTQRCGDLAIISFRLTTSGVDVSPVISPAPPSPLPNESCYYGYLRISPDGRNLCVTANYAEHACLMAYDPSTGLASEPYRWKPFPMPVGSLFPTSGGYGVEFSPGSTRLYLQTFSPRMLVQYDMLAADTAAFRASRYVVDSAGIDPQNPGSYLYGGALQLAPNGSLYANRLNKTYLSAVPFPEALGVACGYVEQALDISPLQCADGLPNHLPSYVSCTTMLPPPASVAVSMPNVFTPNADGVNDRFAPFGDVEGISGTLDIHDRWGDTLFSTTDLLNGWDGKVHDHNCTDGIYFYRIHYSTPTGTLHEAHGTLALFSSAR